MDEHGEHGEHEWLAREFEGHRRRLEAVAYRMVGSTGEAQDAVQEAWLRASRAGADGVENLGGWLTTIVARVCLNMLEARRSRREESLGAVPGADRGPRPSRGPGDPAASGPDDLPNGDSSADPEQEAVIADSVGVALLVVLETLTPLERLAFVLHDMFAVPFEEIAVIVDRTPAAARQLASRARRRVHGTGTVPDADAGRQRELVEAFLAASRAGDFEALLAVLDPDVVLRADLAVVPPGLSPVTSGAAAVARGALMFARRARLGRLAQVDGAVGIVLAPQGRLQIAVGFVTAGDRITEISVFADPDRLASLHLAVLDP